MQKSFNNVIKSFAEAAFVSGTTIFPINTAVSDMFMLVFVVSFLTDIFCKKLADRDVGFFHLLRDYLPSLGTGLIAHALVLGSTGGPPIHIAIYGVLGVVSVLFYFFSILVLLAKRNVG
ncbi:hypothetical protein ACU8KO_002651 [Vibrio alginolyticus]